MKSPLKIAAFLILAALVTFSCDDDNGDGGPDPLSLPIEPQFACENGLANDQYSCSEVHLVSTLSLTALGTERLNDIWGWTDPQTGTEYVLVGMFGAVSFIDLSDPRSPVILGQLLESNLSGTTKGTTDTPQLAHDDDEHEGAKSIWRDVKVFQNHAFVVSDAQPHGMQVFDLTRLRGLEGDRTRTFQEDLVYTEFGNAHNLAINEETGFAYVVGSNTFGGGLHIIDINTPTSPAFAGSFQDDVAGRNRGTAENPVRGYVHDTQCVTYAGPDSDYTGREICFNSGETHVVIVDVTDKSNPVVLSRPTTPNVAYIHQGWLTPDHRYFLMNDELDERNNLVPSTTTYIFDVNDLDNPSLSGIFANSTSSADHNLYTKGNLIFQSNYSTGLRILDASDLASGTLREVGYFDTLPGDNSNRFVGAWSSYPYFESGAIVVSDIFGGLFVLTTGLE